MFFQSLPQSTLKTKTGQVLPKNGHDKDAETKDSQRNYNLNLIIYIAPCQMFQYFCIHTMFQKLLLYTVSAESGGKKTLDLC